MDMCRASGGSETGPGGYGGVGVDPRLWRFVTSRPVAGSGEWQSTAPLDRPAIYLLPAGGR